MQGTHTFMRPSSAKIKTFVIFCRLSTLLLILLVCIVENASQVRIFLIFDQKSSTQLKSPSPDVILGNCPVLAEICCPYIILGNCPVFVACCCVENVSNIVQFVDL